MGKIYWTKNDGESDLEKKTPFPNYNMLRNEIIKNSARYVNLDTREKALEIYDKSSDEILKFIRILQENNREQEILINDLNSQLQKWKEQQNGRKSILTKEKKDQIIKCKKMKLSNREIARNLKVSEGTIRNFIKTYEENIYD